MTPLRLAVLAVSVLLPVTHRASAEDEKSQPLRYVRPDKSGLVLESEITETRTADGATYQSRTDRGTEKMTLTLQFDKDGQVVAADAVRESDQGKQSAVLKVKDGKGQLSREGGVTDLIKVPGNPVVTTAPDWSDIFLLVRRYDARKAGRQEFPGLWIHPNKPHLLLTFSVERLGTDAVVVADRKLPLVRYRVHLRSGDYLVWADAAGRVLKLFPAGKPGAYVVLDGFDEATRDLQSK